MIKRRELILAVQAAVLGTPRGLFAQQPGNYPTKPVRIIVPTAAGGGDDVLARLLAERLSALLGQQFYIENRPGAGGMIGQTAAAKSPPDGYTLLLAGASMAGARFVNANMGYDLSRDFTPVSMLEISPFVLVVNPALPAANVKELIALARSRPGQMSFGTGRRPDSLLVGDAVQQDGGNRRPRGALPGCDRHGRRADLGPPPGVVCRLNRAVTHSLASADLRARLLQLGSVPVPSTPEELGKRNEDWTKIFGKIAQDVGLKPQ